MRELGGRAGVYAASREQHTRGEEKTHVEIGGGGVGGGKNERRKGENFTQNGFHLLLDDI